MFDASILAGPVANFPVADSYNRAPRARRLDRRHPAQLRRRASSGTCRGAAAGDQPHGLAGALLSGWQLAAIVTLQSGIPLAVTQATNFNAFAGFGTQRPNRVADPNLPLDRADGARWFNTDAFPVAPQFTLGTSSRNPVRGPGYRNVDLALHEARRRSGAAEPALELRVEAFNLTNTPPLGAPNGGAGLARLRLDHQRRRPARRPDRAEADLLAAGLHLGPEAVVEHGRLADVLDELGA